MTEDEARALLKPGEWLAGHCRCCGGWLVGRPNAHPMLTDICSDCLTCDRSTGLPCEWSPEGEALSRAAWERSQAEPGSKQA